MTTIDDYAAIPMTTSKVLLAFKNMEVLKLHLPMCIKDSAFHEKVNET